MSSRRSHVPTTVTADESHRHVQHEKNIYENEMDVTRERVDDATELKNGNDLT